MVGFLLTLIKGAVTVAPAVEAVMRQRRAREEQDAQRDLFAERAALQRAWEAVQLQSRERTITLAAFVVGITVLGLTYALALIGELYVLAAAGALAGIVLVAFFNRYDARQRAGLRGVQQVLRDIDQRLAEAGDPPQPYLAQVGPSGLYHETLTLLFQAVTMWGFLAAFVYALVEAV